MPSITYVSHSGEESTVEIPAGKTLMEGAIDNLVDGIIGECGGCCSCATCHVIVDDAWAERTGKPEDVENEMLEAVPVRSNNSRLGCQIQVTEELDGLIVRLPEEQF